MSHILAIDQGTTSTRAILFDGGLRIAAVAQEEFPQHYPASGWVEHDCSDLWSTTAGTCRAVIERAGISASDVAAIGITNQRETTLIWDRRTGRPIHNAIVWQDRRTSDFCQRLKAEGHEETVTDVTGLLLDPYFSGTKVRWLLDNVDGARARAEAGDLAFGTVDSWLIWNLTGGRVHVTDATNAARTLLYDIGAGRWSETMCEMLGVPMALLPEVHDCAADFGTTRPDLFGREIPILGDRGRPAGRHHRAGLLPSGNAQVDLRHGLLRASEHGRRAGAVQQPAPDHHRLPARRETDLRARRVDLRGGRGRAVAARRAEDHPRGG
jgi:glycerol kinase